LVEERILLKRTLLIGLILAASATWAQTAKIVKQVVVKGNTSISTDFIKTSLRSIKIGETFLRSDADKDEDALLNLGFFQDVQILIRELSDTELEIIVEVVENPVIREIRVLGNTVVSTEDITAIVLEHQQLERVWVNQRGRPIREAIQKIYEDEGYFVQLMALEPEQDVPGALKIEILEPRIRNIVFTGIQRTKRRTLERLMKTDAGETLNSTQWRRDLEELYATQWFEKIEPAAPTPTGNPGEFDLAIDFVEARTAQVTAGVALDPQSRLVGTISYSDMNWRGNGQSLGVQMSQATIGGGLSAEVNFRDRFYDENGTTLSASVFSKIQYYFTGGGLGPIGFDDDRARFDQRREGFSVSMNRPTGEEIHTTVGITAQNISTISETDLDPDQFVKQDGDLVMLQLGMALDSRHPTIEPYTGRMARLLIEPGYSDITSIGGAVEGNPEVLGVNRFIRSTLEYRQYWNLRTHNPDADILDQTHSVLVLRAKYGRVDGTAPFFEQLFVGGSNSLRGYDNQRFWGSQSLLATAEYRYPLQKAFNLVGFVDYGGAWDGYGNLRDFEQSANADLHLGYGLGLAFRTPIGPIRIDFAFNDEGGSRTHFQFGTSF
jgi:outer membrane protein insertion porin family